MWLFQNLWLSRASKFLLYEMKLVLNGNFSGLHEKKTINQIIIEHKWNNLRKSMIGTGILICLSCPLYPLLSWNGIENVKLFTWNISMFMTLCMIVVWNVLVLLLVELIMLTPFAFSVSYFLTCSWENKVSIRVSMNSYRE